LPILTSALPGTDKEGFVSKQDVAQQARTLSLAAFVERYPAPAVQIVEVDIGSAPGGEPDATVQPGPQLLTLLRSGGNAFHYEGRVGFLTKRPGNPFPQFVSIGRAANNDLVLAIDAISKFHGYFTCEHDRWALTDYRSMNGIEINDVRLDPGAATPLSDGDRIRFGGRLRALFLSPGGLYGRLRG
jgi:FHA domain